MQEESRPTYRTRSQEQNFERPGAEDLRASSVKFMSGPTNDTLSDIYQSVSNICERE